MNVLKASSTPAGQARVLLRGEAAEPAPKVLPREPGRWVSDAELQALRDHCRTKGREEGLAEGRQQAQDTARDEAQREAKAQLEQELKTRQDKHAKEQAEKWRSLATALAQQAQGLREQLEAEVTEWTFAAVTRLLGQRPPEQVAAAVRQVLAEAKLDEPLTVLLHPQDLPAVQGEDWPAQVRFAADEHVKLGGCRVQSAHQTLDARLEVQLELLREALDAARKER